MTKLANYVANSFSAVEGDAVPTMTSSNRTDFPCSVGQERFWLLDRLDPGNSSYNVAVRWRLEGLLSTSLLQTAWDTIIERHEILRTQFLELHGVITQRVRDRAAFKLIEIDLSHMSSETAQIEADRIGVIEARAPFDLTTSPVLRVTLLRLSLDVAVILVTTHQIVSDGWSIGIMAREMGLIYEALSREEPVMLEPLAIQYADYSLWQLEWLKVRGTAEETTYWTHQLAGAKPFKILPDRARTGLPTTNGAIASRVLPRELTNKAQALSVNHGTTLFTTALASLCAVLARVANAGDIVLGTQVSGRDQVELEPMIGQFVSSLILRNNLSDDPPFNELLGRIAETTAQALEHRHIPIEQLLGLIKPERADGNSPAISVNFIFQKTFIQNTRYSSFSLVDLPSLPTGAIYDLNFFMVERPDGWRFSCQYNTDQFESETAERLIAYFQNAMGSAISNPSKRISDLTLPVAGEARVLTNRLNDCRALYPRELTVSKLFEMQVMRLPDAIAISFDGRQLSYSDLNSAAEKFAYYLSEKGVTAGAVVAVCIERSLELAINILAILKLGATFLVLDPKDPTAHRVAVTKVSNAFAIIQRSDLSWDIRSRSIVINSIIPSIAREIERKWLHSGDVATNACLMYRADATDGSCVALTHGNLVNLIYSLSSRLRFSERDTLIATSNISLDISSVEILLPLLAGARLVLPTELDLENGRKLLQLVQHCGATTMQASSTLWRNLLSAGWVGHPSLKMLCSVSELNSQLADQLSRMGGELWALYGQTESSVVSSAARVNPNHAFFDLKPLANMALCVLDASFQPSPVGATGNLYIGGDRLTVGNSFVTAPINNIADSRLCATGALARLKSNGQLEYLGRADHQFSFRGRHINPASIEALLQRHLNVAQAAVVHWDDPGNGSISAYVVSRTPTTDSEALLTELRNNLAQLLPHDLVPSPIMLSDSLPLMADGEIDRRSLKLSRPVAVRAANVQSSDEIEDKLQKIWCSILRVKKTEPTNNFFELGGHSLLAARMLVQVEKIFNRKIRLAALFAAPTIKGLADILRKPHTREFDFRQMVKIQPGGLKPPLIGINNTGIFFGLSKYLGPDQPVTSLQLFDPSLRNASLPSSLEEIAAGYVELIRRVQPQGPYDLMGWCVAGALAFEIACQIKKSGQEVTHLFLIDSWVPRYLDRLPRVRALIGTYSMRLQIIARDWFKAVSGAQSLSSFFAKRMLVKKISKIFFPTQHNAENIFIADYANSETYDQWLLTYLQKISATYQPQTYPGKLTLLRSRREPAGWFAERTAGWQPFVADGVEVFFIDGDHFTMFNEPGVVQMAAQIAATLDSVNSR